MNATPAYDSILLMSFGGPEGPDEVMPFLERVVAGRGVPRERLLGVAEHYQHFGGVSPINERTRELRDALQAALKERGPDLPLYWGNRFWRPDLADTLAEMKRDGRRRAIAIATSAFSSFSGCRAYQNDLDRELAALGPDAPVVHKVRPCWDAPAYLDLWLERLRPRVTPRTHVLYTAHSIPHVMAEGCDYEAQLQAFSGRLTERLEPASGALVYQSRSGPPRVPWLEPDVLDAIDSLADRAPGASVVVAPIGFVADHMEVVWDLDHEAKERAEERGLDFVRVETANDHPRFVGLLRDRIAAAAAEGVITCPPGCCPPGRSRRPSGAAALDGG